MTATELFVEDPLLLPFEQVVVEVVPEVTDVVTIRSVPVAGPVRSFLPAQVAMVGAFGIGEAAISISSSPYEHGFHEYTVRTAGAITSALTRMERGDRFWVREPFGRPWDLAGDGDIVVVAGGIGLAPLRSAIHALIARRSEFGSVTVVVGARRPADLLYAASYDAWRDAGIDVVTTVDRATPGWSGRVGVVPAVLSELDLAVRRSRALICGPDAMMRRAADALIAMGAAPERIQLTMERNMQCGTGRCGHCQLGGLLVCRDGPVVTYPSVARSLTIGEW